MRAGSPGRRPTCRGSQVITSNRGLLPADTPITAAELGAFAGTEIRADEPGYREPLQRNLAALDAAAVAARRHRVGRGAARQRGDRASTWTCCSTSWASGCSFRPSSWAEAT